MTFPYLHWTQKYILQDLCLGQEINRIHASSMENVMLFVLKYNLQQPLVRSNLFEVVVGGALHCVNYFIFLLFPTKDWLHEIIYNFVNTNCVMNISFRQKTLENIKGAIKKIWTIQRIWQHWVHKKTKQKHNTLCYGMSVSQITKDNHMVHLS